MAAPFAVHAMQYEYLIKEMVDLIGDELVQALFRRGVPTTESARALMALPARYGGIALSILSRMAHFEHSASLCHASPRSALAVNGTTRDIVIIAGIGALNI